MSTKELLRLAEMSRQQVAEVCSRAVLVLPIGALEQHGPALPLGTDAALAERLTEAGLERTDACRPMVLAPTMPFGNSAHHLFACAGSLSANTLLLVLGELIDSFVHSGFRRIFILNGHGGNDECVRLAIKDAVNRHSVLLGAASYWTLCGAGPVSGANVPGHAGAFEASLLMAVRPELLSSAATASQRPGPAAVHTQDFGPGVTVVRSGDWAASAGFTDDPGEAQAAAGRDYAASIANELAAVLERFAELSLPAADSTGVDNDHC